jgi:predicted deacylase
MIQRNVRGALGVLRYLKLYPGPVELVDHPLFLERTEVLTSPATGVWLPAVERGHTVQEGAVIGTVVDFFGSVLAEVRAPFAGEMLYVVATPATSRGEPLGMVGRER